MGTTKCESWATVASPAVVDWVDQMANSSCEAPPEPPSFAPDWLGDELCASIDGGCYYWECRPEWKESVNQLSGWLNDEAIAAARACANEYGCLNKEFCLWSWSLTVWDAIVEGDPPLVTQGK